MESAPRGDVDAIIGARAALLGVGDGVGGFVEQEVGALTLCGPSLLELDNAEHLLEAVADVVAVIGARAARTSVITTSREPLGVSGEVVWRVPSLSVPQSPIT